MTTRAHEIGSSSQDRPPRKQVHLETQRNNKFVSNEDNQPGSDCARSVTTASMSTSTNENKPKRGTKPSLYSPSLLFDAVSGLKEVASDTYSNVRDWANSPQSTMPTPSFFSRYDNTSIYTGTPLSCYPESKAKGDSRKTTPTRDRSCTQQSTRTKPSSPARSLIQDLVSPFLACVLYSDDQPSTREMNQKDFHKRMDINTIGVLERSWTDQQTVASLDSQAEEEMLQLHRLTSWGTQATFGTAATYDTTTTSASLDTNSINHAQNIAGEHCIIGSSVVASTKASTEIVVQDDDGNVIPPELIEHAQRRREQRRTRRKRVVKFDYPPISALRECPRPNPKDLPDLFFTEEELDEIEADRSSANIADDVEIVAVATPSKDDSISSQEDWNNYRLTNKSGSSEKVAPSVGFGSIYPIPKQEPFRKRPPSPHPRKSAQLTSTGNTSNDPVFPTSNCQPKADPRLLKGVQIYLRERSTGQGR